MSTSALYIDMVQADLIEIMDDCYMSDSNYLGNGFSLAEQIGRRLVLHFDEPPAQIGAIVLVDSVVERYFFVAEDGQRVS